MIKEKLIIHHNSGIGDHIICNGLVNYFAERKKIFLICLFNNYISIKYLYSENISVTVLPVPTLKFINKFIKKVFNNNKFDLHKSFSKFYSILFFCNLLYVGFDKIKYPEWDRSFYETNKLSFNIRYEKLRLPKKEPSFPKKINLEDEYILIQDETSKSKAKFELKIHSEYKKIYINKKLTKNFFSNIHLIKNAKEIHCIDSSLVHLVEAVDDINSQLFFHDIRKHYQNSFFSARKFWNIVKYDDCTTWGSGIKLSN